MELAVVAEVLGRAPPRDRGRATALVAAVVAESGPTELAKELLPGLVDGSLPGHAGRAHGDARRLRRCPCPA